MYRFTQFLNLNRMCICLSCQKMKRKINQKILQKRFWENQNEQIDVYMFTYTSLH